MWPGLRKGLLCGIVIRITLNGRPIMFFFMFSAISTVNGTITPLQDSFFVFQCYTGSTETVINVISNTTASTMPLITVFANSLHQAYPFRNQKQQLTHVTTIILRTETTLRALEACLAPPNGEMRTNLPRTWWNAYVSCIIISSYLEKYGKASYTRAYLQTIREPNARMCGQDCKPALRHLWMVRILFAANRNLLVFLHEHKENWMCLHAPGVPCSPQVRRKLINRAPLMRLMRMAQRVSSELVYAKLNILRRINIWTFWSSWNKKIRKNLPPNWQNP